ncbi:MAG: hypothetical protein INF75_00685 [Roseomonas sp.]|nr:hypothetical protein [Roseomonas sp.]MCA3330776.1 hypothetical protein [Roseomonas sp.]MCA3334265.1 hypothetical protein [Roseomonas sp.]MCA3347311.1 hypothetical protein [Roseomonas sp.]MCA3354628.1 hypothetical protein [Roseomonas sp.]
MSQDNVRRSRRTILVVEDTHAEGRARFKSVSATLDYLEASQISRLRDSIQNSRISGKSRFLCGECREPVYLSLSGCSHFSHHANGPKNCPWNTISRHPEVIDTEKFAGRQESPEHRELKALLASTLAIDPGFSEIRTEEVVSCPPAWRKPDVIAKFGPDEIAFDIQLATTQMPTIYEREKFYQSNSIRYIWLISTKNVIELQRQGFQDIYWHNHGQIFEIDEKIAMISREIGRAFLYSLTIEPEFRNGTFKSIWKREPISISGLDWSAETFRPARKKSFADCFRHWVSIHGWDDSRKKLINAARDQSRRREFELIWRSLEGQLAIPDWHEAEKFDPFKTVGVLSTVAAGQKLDASRFSPDEIPQIINDFLEKNSCRGWTATLKTIAEAYNKNELLEVKSSTVTKIERNLMEEHPDLKSRFLPILCILFPKAALDLLGKVPTEIQNA